MAACVNSATDANAIVEAKLDLELKMEWQQYRYYQIYRRQFTFEECDRIIDLHVRQEAKTSVLFDSTGAQLRNSDVFWVHPTPETEWIFSRLIAAVEDYNKNYNFEISYEPRAAQLTRYKKHQQYGWHMDLGKLKSSRRKVSAVVELTSSADCLGGGIEIFYGDEIDNRANIGKGDIVMFPSFVMHRASQVHRGTRWSLVFWFVGKEPFK